MTTNTKPTLAPSLCEDLMAELRAANARLLEADMAMITIRSQLGLIEDHNGMLGRRLLETCRAEVQTYCTKHIDPRIRM